VPKSVDAIPVVCFVESERNKTQSQVLKYLQKPFIGAKPQVITQKTNSPSKAQSNHTPISTMAFLLPEEWSLKDMHVSAGEIAIVTGGASGVGFEVAKQLGKSQSN
jgi:hypothetical protein